MVVVVVVVLYKHPLAKEEYAGARLPSSILYYTQLVRFSRLWQSVAKQRILFCFVINKETRLGLTSLVSLERDETFLSLESLVRLFPKVSQNIIFFFGMFLAGKLLKKTQNFWHLKNLMHRNAIKMTDGLKLWDSYKDIAFWTIFMV